METAHAVVPPDPYLANPAMGGSHPRVHLQTGRGWLCHNDTYE